MNIAGLRSKFISETGRVDLTQEQADEYINNGVRLLDEATHFAKTEARQFISVSAGDRKATFSSDCRSIGAVWVIDKVAGRTKLIRADYDKLMEYFGDVADVESGDPEYYAALVIRPYPDTFNPAIPPFDEYSDYIDTEADYHNIRGITFLPPTDEDRLIEIRGKFYSSTLDDTVTENWWSIYHERAVLDAAKYVLESIYRNRSGMADFSAAMSPVLRAIDYDIAEDESAEITEMEG